jgi:MSHA biogenesis protein MshI
VIAAVRLARVEDPSTPASLLVVAAQRRAVAQAVQPLASAGIDVLAVDVPEMAQRNLLAMLPGADLGQALLSLDQSSGLLTVIKQGELCFARRILMPRSNAVEEEDPEHVATRIATQIQRSVEVVERQSGLAPVQTVWIGPHPYAALIARCTVEQTGIDCPQLDLQAEVRFAGAAPDLASESAAGALLAIGAALRDEDPDSEKKQRTSAGSLAWLARHKAAA